MNAAQAPEQGSNESLTTPFGWWPSPFTASAVAAGKVSRSGLQADGDWFYWSESRPADGGRQVVVRGGRDDGSPVDVSPATSSVRTRVHEYGGGAATVAGGVLYFVDQNDQRLYRHHPGSDEPPLALTPASGPPGSPSFRYADGRVVPAGGWVVCIEERHDRAGTDHRVVAVATDGSEQVVPLVDAGDFVSAPRPSPDGALLAWVTWSHPDMSWDSSEVWVADLHREGGRIRAAGARRIAGGDQVSVGQPRWCRDGSLLFVSDRTGWWLPYRVVPASTPRSGATGGPPVADHPPLVGIDAEFHAPDWALGQSTMVELSDGSLVCRMRHGGRDHLAHLRPPTGEVGQGTAPGPEDEMWTVEAVEQPCVTITGIAMAEDGSRLAVSGATPTMAAVIGELTMVETDETGRPPSWRLLSAAPEVAIADGDVAVAQPFVAATESGPVPGLFYRPANASIRDTAREGPPLVVFCHGGPTGAAEPGFDPIVQFFTSRGLAVAAVDYRGSSGYGRQYRRRLQGLWGEADIDDCTAYAVALADAGWVDGRRMVIRGSSAGGLTALGALVRSDKFAGAASWYGVADLEALAADTHDFESRYLDGLIGPLPGAAAIYRRRSPIHHAGEVSGAVLLLQGQDDPVVPAAQSERFAEALVAHGVPCRLEVFPGESHGFRRAATIEACLLAELAFYRSVVGVRPQLDPPGDVAG